MTTIDEGRNAAIKSIIASLLQAGIEDEDRWVHFIQVVNEAGRFVMGFPQLESSESDIFGALDDIASELSATKTAILQTTREARVAQHELHQALEPLLPEEAPLDPAWSSSQAVEAAQEVKLREPEQPDEPPTAVTPSAAPRANQSESPSPESADSQANDSLAVPSPVEEPAPRVGRGALEPVAKIAPVHPNAEDERLFAAIRKLGNDATYDRVAEEADAYSGAKIHQRLALLAKYEKLPGDIVAWRAYRSTRRGAGALPPRDRGRTGEQRVREVAAEIKSRDSSLLNKNVAEMGDFMARRKANAAEAADRSWKARHA